MDNKHPMPEMAGSAGGHVLGRIFDRHIEETISDGQVEQVLAPVLVMVRQGRFERSRNSQRGSDIPYLLAATAMVAVMVVALVASISAIRLFGSERFVETVEYVQIPQTSVPLSGPQLIAKVAPEYAALVGGDMRNVELAIVEPQDGKLHGTSAMGEDRVFRFDSPLADGTYRAVAMLPARDENVRGSGIEIGSVVVAGGSAHLELSVGLENFWEGVEIQICLMGSG